MKELPVLLPLCTGQLWSGVENICLASKVNISAYWLQGGLQQTWVLIVLAHVLLVRIVLLISGLER